MPSNAVRHAISRSTGATTWTRKEDDEWKTTCLNHKAETTAPNRGAAWKNGSTPTKFCAKCAQIVKGKQPKITGDRLAIPKKAPAKKAAPKKAPAKPTTTATKKAVGSLTAGKGKVA